MLVLALSAAFAADPVIEGIDDAPNVVVKSVDSIDFTEIVDVNARVQGPSIGDVFVVTPKWTGSFIRLRDSWDVEIARSLHAVK